MKRWYLALTELWPVWGKIIFFSFFQVIIKVSSVTAGNWKYYHYSSVAFLRTYFFKYYTSLFFTSWNRSNTVIQRCVRRIHLKLLCMLLMKSHSTLASYLILFFSLWTQSNPFLFLNMYNDGCLYPLRQAWLEGQEEQQEKSAFSSRRLATMEVCYSQAFVKCSHLRHWKMSKETSLYGGRGKSSYM